MKKKITPLFMFVVCITTIIVVWSALALYINSFSREVSYKIWMPERSHISVGLEKMAPKNRSESQAFIAVPIEAYKALFFSGEHQIDVEGAHGSQYGTIWYITSSGGTWFYATEQFKPSNLTCFLCGKLVQPQITGDTLSFTIVLDPAVSFLFSLLVGVASATFVACYRVLRETISNQEEEGDLLIA